MGNGRVAAILRDGATAAAVVVLTEPGHCGAAYELTGPDDLSLRDAARIMSGASGRDIGFHDETDEEAFASRAQYSRQRA